MLRTAVSLLPGLQTDECNAGGHGIVETCHCENIRMFGHVVPIRLLDQHTTLVLSGCEFVRQVDLQVHHAADDGYRKQEREIFVAQDPGERTMVCAIQSVQQFLAQLKRLAVFFLVP